MKTFHFLLSAFFILQIFSSCQEQCPLLSNTPTDTTQATQQKNILIEEFTGVKCVQCPEGHAIAQSIADAHNGRVEIVSIHSGFYAVPFPFSLYNFKIPEGTAIENLIGPASFYPTAGIDRKLFSGQTDILLDKNFWAGNAAAQLQEPLKVKINFNNTYNPSERKLTANISLAYLEEITDAQSITVLITENDIIDAQETPQGVDTFYVHKHVLRAVLTNAIGDLITESTPAGAIINRSYTFTLPAAWNDTKCRVVAFVARNTSDSKEVLQVNAKYIRQ
jgi:hypothetical protein